VYEIKAHSAIKKDLRRLDKAVRAKIQEEHLPKIQVNPFIANPLLHDLKGLWSYRFSYRGVQYRIIYEIHQEQKLVVLIMITSREKAYEKLRRRLGLT
jgi:mRNA-degrading endonuclease RelE of RelBE toxin-antitoxin system